MTLLRPTTSSSSSTGGDLPLQLNIDCGNTNDHSVRRDAGADLIGRSAEHGSAADCSTPDQERALPLCRPGTVTPPAGGVSSGVSAELSSQIDLLVDRRRTFRKRPARRQKPSRRISDNHRTRANVSRGTDQSGSRQSVEIPSPSRGGKHLQRGLRTSRQKDRHAQILEFLTVTNRNPYAEVITGTPENPHHFGNSLRGSRSLHDIAVRVVRASSMAVGMRPEGRVRWSVVDLDAKPDKRSPYWDKNGQHLCIQALQQAACEIGCQTEVIRSSHSGGLHIWIFFPAELHVSRAHHLTKRLTEQAGMHKVNAECEIFPSEIRWVPQGAPIPRSNGIRLPGGKGSALIRNGQFISEPSEIYKAFMSALSATELKPEWESLIADAYERSYESSRQRFDRQKAGYGKRKLPMPGPWTGPGQSNHLTGEYTKFVLSENPGERDDMIEAKTRKLIEDQSSYHQHASNQTKREVSNGSKIRGWLKYYRERSGLRSVDEKPRNSAHNAEQMERVEASLIEQLQLHGQSVLEWSKRRLMRETGLNFRTVSKWWDRLSDLLIKVLHTPPIKALQHLELFSNGCSCSKSLDPAVSIPPIASAEAEPSGVPAQTVKTTDQNGFSLKIRSNFARLRGWTSSIVRPDRRAVIPFEMDGDPSSGEGSNPTHAAREIESSKSLPSRVVLTPEERRQVERAELERWIAAG